MTKPSSRKPLATFDGQQFHIEWRGRSVDVATHGDDEERLVELDNVTHWSDEQEITIEDLGAILEAIEDAAEDAGVSVTFE